MKRCRVILLSAVAMASACTTPSKKPARAELPIEATVVWGNQGRGGAAERLPGYIHALHRGGVVYRDAPASPEPQPPNAAFVAPGVQLPSALLTPELRAVAPSADMEVLPPQTVAAIAAVSGRDARPEPFQAAEATSNGDKLHRAWQTYCDGGHGMTDADWQRVHDAGAPENVPADLARQCVHPK